MLSLTNSITAFSSSDAAEAILYSQTLIALTPVKRAVIIWPVPAWDDPRLCPLANPPGNTIFVTDDTLSDVITVASDVTVAPDVQPVLSSGPEPCFAIKDDQGRGPDAQSVEFILPEDAMLAGEVVDAQPRNAFS